MVPQRRPDRSRRFFDWPRAALLSGTLLLTAAIGIAIAGGGVAALQPADAGVAGSDQPIAQQNGSTTTADAQDANASEQDGTGQGANESDDQTDGAEESGTEDSNRSSDQESEPADSDSGSDATDTESDDSANESADTNSDSADQGADENTTIDDVNASEGAESAQQDGDATTITECTAIEEPGTYDLSDDLENRDGREVSIGAGMTRDVCIGIRSSGVVLNGNGNVVSGTGASQSVGVQVFATDGTEVSDVTVRNLRVENWHNGVEIGLSSWYLPQDNPASATLEGVTAASNQYHGVYAAAASGSEFVDVSATGNAEAGIGLFDADSVTITDSTASNNGEHGVALFEGVFDGEYTGLTATDNGGAGVYLGQETSGNTFTDVTATGNDGSGIERVDGERNQIQDATVEG